jgi:LuxR family transcriptional regulator, maltose regulon positive regulatory protein
MDALLRSKLFIPRPRKNLVFRSNLVERLNAGLEKELTLISAPAGFGKTTLLCEWITHSPNCVTWLSLDANDNNPARFWAYFIASLQELDSDLGVNALALIKSPQAPFINSILTELINDLIAFARPFASVLDDYHFIDSQPIHKALTFLIDHIPANMNLIITTREDPPLPLARLRARDQLIEIRARDLRFTQQQSGDFLQSVMGLELSQQDIAALDERTEGWAAGLQLAGLSIRGQTDPKAFITDFSGSHRYILDYLTDEVLQQQPEFVRSFMLHTAILDRLSGPLCEALTGRNDSDKLLAKLDAGNLFVIPLDEERHWYRYHHLFADLLRSELTRTQPDWIPELHRRASRWYEENGDIQAAIEHALQDSDLTRAANLIQQNVMPLLYLGQVARVLSWLDRLPEAVLEAAPMLSIGKAWALILMQHGARQKEAERAVQAARQALDRVNAGEALRNLVNGHAATLQAFKPQTTELAGKEPEEQISLYKEALRLLPEDQKAIRSVNTLSIGVSYLALGDLEAASTAFNQTLEDGLAGGNHFAAIYGQTNLVECAFLVGRLKEALQLCEANIERFNRLLAGQYFPPIGALYVLKGSILLEWNRLIEAEDSLREGIELIRWTGEYSAHKNGFTTLARLRAIQGDRTGMQEAVKTLEYAWPEGVRYAEALRHRLTMRHWPEDPDARKEAQIWLAQSGIEFGELAVIHGVGTMRESIFATHLSAAQVLAGLAKEIPGIYPLEDVHAYLKRQEDAAVTYGLTGWVVEIAIARTLLHQAAGKKNETLRTLQAALSAAAHTGLLRIFLDECESLHALLEELKPQLTDRALVEYAGRLLEGMNCAPAKPATLQGHPEVLSARELEVLRSLASGLTYEEIGQQLFLSLNTIQFHVKNIYGKLLVNKRVQAIEKARQLKLI